jgi:hypothetical protein
MICLIHFRAVIRGALRLLCLGAGAWLAVVVPAAHSANLSRELNAAMGHLPDMDPGTGISLAVLLAVPVLVALVVIELCRAWAWGARPLPLPSLFVLGVVATWPIGVSAHGILWACPLSIGAFYGVRNCWMARRAKA